MKDVLRIQAKFSALDSLSLIFAFAEEGNSDRFRESYLKVSSGRALHQTALSFDGTTQAADSELDFGKFLESATPFATQARRVCYHKTMHQWRKLAEPGWLSVHENPLQAQSRGRLVIISRPGAQAGLQLEIACNVAPILPGKLIEELPADALKNGHAIGLNDSRISTNQAAPRLENACVNLNHGPFIPSQGEGGPTESERDDHAAGGPGVRQTSWPSSFRLLPLSGQEDTQRQQ